MTTNKDEIARLKALLKEKNKENRELRSKVNAFDKSKENWKNKYKEAKKESKAKDVELKKKLRLRKDTMEVLSDLLLQQSKDIPFGQR